MLVCYQILESLNNTVISTGATFTTGSDPSVKTIIQLATSQPTGTYTFNVQLEEGSVATPYEDPWVNTLTFNDNLHSGEFLQKSKGIFYIHKTWYRDKNNNPYETLTFVNGVATPSAIAGNMVIVQDVNTGEIKNALVNGSQVNVYENQYDSFSGDDTTTTFNLSKTSLTTNYPVAVNETVITSGFTQSATQIVFNTAPASGSTVSCVYPYLDTSYNSQAMVFYQSAPQDKVIYPIESGSFKTVATTNDLPLTPNIGDMYFVTSKALFYLWTGLKWQVIGGGGPVLLASNEDTMSTSSSDWTGLKGFTLLNGAIQFSMLAVKVVAYGSGSLRLVVFDYSGASALVVGNAVAVNSSNPTLFEINLDISSLSSSTAYMVSLQGQNITVVATEFYGS